jgi:hypothetical protein
MTKRSARRRRLEEPPFDLEAELKRLGPAPTGGGPLDAWRSKRRQIEAEAARDRAARHKALKRVIGGAYSDVAPWQEQHSKTVGQMRGAREGEATNRRRLVDARFWDRLGSEQTDAAELIGKAYESITSGQRFVTAKYGARGDKGHESDVDRFGTLQQRYFRWITEANTRNIAAAAVIEMICLGEPPSRMDLWRVLYNGLSEQSACWSGAPSLAAFLRQS